MSEIYEDAFGNEYIISEGEIKVGDMVVCIGGKKLGGRQRCTVVEVSDSKKTYILEDSEGVRFRKHRHTIEK